MTVPYFLGVNARMHGHRTAVVCEDDRVTWREFDEGINRAANMLLSLGLKKGEKVVLVMDTSIAMLEMIFGITRAGGVVITLNPALPAEALSYMINKLTGARLFAAVEQVELIDSMRAGLLGIQPRGFYVFGDSRPGWLAAGQLLSQASANAPDVNVAATDTMDITFTSGTTGRPKGIELVHQARFNYGWGLGLGLHMDRHSVTICTTPLYTNACWVLMIPALQNAGTVVLMKRFDPHRFLELVDRERCTHLYLLPFQATAVTECGRAMTANGTSALRVLSGGAMLPDKTHGRLRQIFPNVEVHLLYGQSEGFTTIAGPKDFALGKHGTMGMAVFGADLRLIDRDGNDLGIGAEGEIVFHGPGMMKGYFADPEKTAEIIWKGPQGRTYLRTGDFGRIDEQGYLFFLGRAQDVIRYKNQSLFASQIERIFSQHPDVKEASVCGIEDELAGEIPVAFVILREGAAKDPAALLAWAKQHAASQPIAADVMICEEFPRGSLEKVQRKALAATYIRKPPRDVNA